ERVGKRLRKRQGHVPIVLPAQGIRAEGVLIESGVHAGGACRARRRLSWKWQDSRGHAASARRKGRTFGSEGWGFEYLRARSSETPSGPSGRGVFRISRPRVHSAATPNASSIRLAMVTKSPAGGWLRPDSQAE